VVAAICTSAAHIQSDYRDGQAVIPTMNNSDMHTDIAQSSCLYELLAR